MTTPLQTFHLAAFRRALRTAGVVFAFGEEQFFGVVSTLQPDDPRMAGSQDRMIELVVETAALPNPRPARQDELTSGTSHYRVSRIDDEIAVGLTKLILSPA